MIEGRVNAAYEPVVALTVQSRAGHELDVSGVVDTGFNRFLTLPPSLIADLDLPLVGVSQVVLANGSEETLDMHGATVLWDGVPRDIDVLVADTTPLVGMSLLDGYELHVQVREGGRVLIEPDE